jgi:GTP-binding protein
MSEKPIVAIVGRPNVGKSTLFNRLAGRRDAIVSDVAGTTRDRVTAETVWADRPFILVDTGGLDASPETEMAESIQGQAHVAMDDADVIVALVDANEGPAPGDMDVADLLRRTDKPVVLAVNKADNQLREAVSSEFYALGLGDPLPISAYHNLGIDDLVARVVELFPDSSLFPEPEADIKLAIVGRTNVGKSMLVNAITGQERAIVSDVPGTTRDALDTLVTHGDRSILLIDTAGIRRRGRVEPGIERYSVLRAVRAIDRADVVVLVTDASELATSQDSHIAGPVLDSHKGMVIAVNKWDLSGDLDLTREDALRRVADRFKFARYTPIRFVSALTGSGVGGLLDTVQSVYDEWTKGVPRYDLRRTVMNAVADNPPSPSGRRSLKIYSVAQDGTGPPSFTFYVNRSDMVHFSYRRYLENSLRATYDFKGSPLRMRFKGRGER